MIFSQWSESRAGSVAPTGFVVGVLGVDSPVSAPRSFRASLQALLTFVVFFAAAAALAGCSSSAAKLSSNGNSQTPVILVVMGQNPPDYMVTGTSTQVSATAYNDASQAGVDWVVNCGSPGNCGSFSPQHTASGENTTFTAPTVVPPHATLTILALSATDHSKSVSVSVPIRSTVTGISITSVPPTSIPANVIVNFSAVVSGDPANLGVDWTATCLGPDQPVDCSSYFSSRFGLGNNSIPFTVPTSVTVLGGGAVSLVGTQITITARPTADHSMSARFVFTVTNPISISITQAPPETMQLSAKASLSAVVTNDTLKAGVTWSVSCTSAPDSDCGSVAPSRSGSGDTVIYTAPAVAPLSSVTIEAAAYATSVNVSCGQSIGKACQNAIAKVDVVVPISVSITQRIPSDQIAQNAGAFLFAAVSNDPSNAGVDWTVTCGNPGNCGSFSKSHTASGTESTRYTAPSAPPGGDNTVTITATSTATASTTNPVSDQQKVTILGAPPPNSLLNGKFVLYLNAKNSQNGPFVLAGVFTGDGNGSISRNGGNFELVDASGNASNSIFVTSPSTYSIGLDGRGQIQLTIDLTSLKPNASFGVPVPGTKTCTLTLSVVFVTEQQDSLGVPTQAHALLTETDGFGDATGTLDLQSAADLASFAGLNGTYSLQLTGTQLVPPYPAFFEDAAITFQTSGSTCTITGHTADQSDTGVITSAPFATASQNLPGCSIGFSTGEIQQAFVPLNLGLPQQFFLNFWLIDKDHFVVTDSWDFQYGNSVPLFGGYLTSQPPSPALSGTVAFTEAGATALPQAQPQVAGGIFTCGSTGSLDVVSLNGTPLIDQPISTATCGAPANGRGLISLSAAGSSGISNFAAYPTIDGSFYLLELDGGSAGTSGPSGAGVAYQQTLPFPISVSALAGNYAAQFSATTQPGSQAFTGQIVSDGASTVNGTVDVNSFTTSPAAGSPSLGATLNNGTFTARADGRFPLTFTITPATNQPAPQISTLNPACYVVDQSTCLLLGLSASAPGVGILQLQKNLP